MKLRQSFCGKPFIGLFLTTCVLALPVILPAQAGVPVNGTSATLGSVTVNNGPGGQNDSPVSGDWAVYSPDLSIRYYNFATNADAQIPMGTSASDLLSDISGSNHFATFRFR